MLQSQGLLLVSGLCSVDVVMSAHVWAEDLGTLPGAPWQTTAVTRLSCPRSQRWSWFPCESSAGVWHAADACQVPVGLGWESGSCAVSLASAGGGGTLRLALSVPVRVCLRVCSCVQTHRGCTASAQLRAHGCPHSVDTPVLFTVTSVSPNGDEQPHASGLAGEQDLTHAPHPQGLVTSPPPTDAGPRVVLKDCPVTQHLVLLRHPQSCSSALSGDS